MSADNPAHLSLRAHLRGLATSVAACNPYDRDALDQVHRQLMRLRLQLERDHVLDQLTPMSVAAQIAEHLVTDGRVSAERGLALIDEVVARACERLDVERPAGAEETLPGPTTETPRVRLQLLSSRKLGEIMVQLALLDAKQVERALAYQHSKGCRLGEALVELGLVSKEAVQNALRVQRKRNDQPNDPWRNTA